MTGSSTCPDTNRSRSVFDAGRWPSDLPPGQLIGNKYRFEALIAEGGMGIVLRATHVELGSQVAIKVVRPEHAANEEVVDRLLAEARIAASLRSTHVNRVLDVGRFPSGVPYLVLEYLEGSDLAERLTELGHFPPSQAVDYVLQACEGLAEAHAIGIVHRDLKPENLFLSEESDGDRVLKILDFGVSKAPRSHGGRVLTKPWQMAGSPCYMAPEQVQGADVDGRADVWALGVVLYELCTGELPFDADSVKEICLRVLSEEPVPPSWLVEDLDQTLEHIIFKCLRKQPEERYASVVELAEALRPYASDPSRVGRVEKVAATTLDRMGSGRVSQRRSDAWSPTTPITLASSRLARVPLDAAPLGHRALLVLGMSLAVGVALSGALDIPSWLAPPAPASPALPVLPALPSPVPASTLDLELEALAATRPAEHPRPVPEPPPAARAAPRLAPQPLQPASSPRPASSAMIATYQPTEPNRPLPEPAAPATASSSPARLDAWDRKSFGGRR
ncbi:MAG TPA: serine/threonine-protein kinase [Polyangiaceae bacterium]|nr:serine/threonine-protein kinase [Polyangiaceae bacterium]